MAGNTASWIFNASADNAVKGLTSIANQLLPIQKTTLALSQKGGVAGAIAGDASGKLLQQINTEIKTTQTTITQLQQSLKSTSDLGTFRSLSKDIEAAQSKLGGLKDEQAQIQQVFGKGVAGGSTNYSTLSTQREISNVIYSFNTADGTLGKVAR